MSGSGQKVGHFQESVEKAEFRIKTTDLGSGEILDWAIFCY